MSLLNSFVWDIQKNALNTEKHGVTFEQAVELWSDHSSKELYLFYEGEERWMRIGKLDRKIWVAIFTVRKERIRLISVRRARKKEEDFYEKE